MQEYTLNIPTINSSCQSLVIDSHLIFVGANGSGKTRLGAWLEFQPEIKDKVLRVSAQKSLSMSDNAKPISVEKALEGLLYGITENESITEGQRDQYKRSRRWARDPNISLLQDFGKLMVYLFSEQTEVCVNYQQQAKLTSQRISPPVTKLDQVKSVFEKLLPHKELILEGLVVKTKIRDSSRASYPAKEMSDGERVIFYLIGQSLSAPDNGVFIVDEPEIHIHRSIQEPLWREIEKLRPDCLFIYFTHDIQFSTSFPFTKKIWLKAFDGEKWEWEVINDIQGIPNELLIEIMGSRKPVLFVEGENISTDVALYRAILPEYLVIPSGSCHQVIQYVKALFNNPQLHHLEVYGIIDRDRRSDREITALEAYKIYTLDVAEVENLFCVEGLIKLVSKTLRRNKNQDFADIKIFIKSQLSRELASQTSLRVLNELKHELNMFTTQAKEKAEIASDLTELVNNINVEFIYDTEEKILSTAIADDEYSSILKYFNRKSLPNQISPMLGLTKGGLSEMVVRMANGDKSKLIRRLLRKYFGHFGEKL